MLKVALTGGIGSGKSIVANEFLAYGVPIIDADVIARDLLTTDTTLLTQINDQFGSKVFDSPGIICRPKLRELVFHDPAAKSWLEQAMHPKIIKQIQLQADTVCAIYYIVVIPLLVETGLQRLFQQVIVVDASIEIQKSRVLARDGVADAQVDAIINSQASRAERLHYADYIIDNNHDFSATKEQVSAIMRDLTLKY